MFSILLAYLPLALLQENADTRRYLKGTDITNFNINDLLKKFKDEDEAPTLSPSASSAFSSPTISTLSESTTLVSTTSSSSSVAASQKTFPHKPPPNALMKPCMQSLSDINKEIHGIWTNSDGNNRMDALTPPVFATSQNTDEWFKSACPVELITASCYHRGGVFYDIAKRAENRDFIPSGCSLSSYNATDFLSRLENRKVLFVFDSISKQIWTYLVCSIRHLDPKAEFGVKWIEENDLTEEERISCPRGAPHCRFSTASAYFPKFQTTFIYQHLHLHPHMSHKKFDIIGLFKSYKLRPRDLVVANFGHNFHQGGAIYKNFLRKFSDDYEFGVLKIRDQMPTLLWMETSPQHFLNTTINNGYYNGLDVANIGKCGAYVDVGYDLFFFFLS